jgi:hypothetical protein
MGTTQIPSTTRHNDTTRFGEFFYFMFEWVANDIYNKNNTKTDTFFYETAERQ